MRYWIIAILLLAACKKEKQMSGVENWNVNRTRLKDATGRCTPDGDGMYCFGQKPMGIRGMVTDIDLYFGGQDPEAKLVEIQMKVGSCDDEQLYGWMQTNFGRPVEDKGSRKLWKSKFVYAIGEMPVPDEPGRCLVHIIPVGEKARYERLWPPS